MSIRSRLLICLLALAHASSAGAQSTRTIPSGQSCARCRVVFHRVAVLGNSGNVSLMKETRVAVDSRGRFILAPTYNSGRIAMYDPNGRLVRELGRPGQGPGEFGRISRLTVGPGDTVHVFELNRHSVLAPGLAGFVSVVQLPVPPRYVAFLADGRMIVQNMVVNQQGIGEPMHLIGPRGEIEHSFGGMGPWRPTEIYQSLRAIAPASGNRVWAARNTEYRIELWDPKGTQPILTLIRDADWFRPWSESDLHDSLETLQRPHLTSVSEGPDGLLWTIIARPDPAWKLPERRGEIPVRDLDSDAMFNTIIEVIDPESGRLIASAEHQKSVSNFIGAGGMVYTKREDLEGNTLIDVWRMEVTTPDVCESARRCR